MQQIDYEMIERRLQLRIAIEAGLARLKSAKQRRVLELVLNWYLDSDEALNLSDLASEHRMPQSSFHELYGRALVALGKELQEDPVIRTWLATGGTE